MQEITINLKDDIRSNWGSKELPPFQQFASIYFYRNNTYLQSAYLLASGAFCGPSRDLQRTVFETILRGYLFIVDNREAELMYHYIEGKIAKGELATLRKRNFWPFEYVVKMLYSKDRQKKHKTLFEGLSRFSHPSILSAFKDLEYSATEIEDCLNCTLCLSYGSIQMISEGFLNLLTLASKKKIKETLLEIADCQGEIALFEPNKQHWSSKIKLKSGNFISVLK